MDRFAAYKEAVARVETVEDLTAAICALGLYPDPRGIYDDFEGAQLAGGGAWQNPLELAHFLMGCRDLFREAGIRRFLEIGTFNGFTFFAVREFLRAHVCPELCARTVDPNDFVGPEIRPYIGADIRRGTVANSRDPGEEPWDLVFIDGNHEAPGPTDDFEAIRHSGTKIAVFHDIVDRFCPAVREAFATYAAEFPSRTYTYSKSGNFGIGVIILAP